MLDGSYKSRKFILVLICCVLLSAGWYSLQWLRFLEATYLHYTAGLMGLVGLYFGVNAVGKSMVLKSQSVKTEEVIETKPYKKTTKTEEPSEEINNGE